MPYSWPTDTVFTRHDLDVENRLCRLCRRTLTICDHRHCRLFTLAGPLHVACKLAHCPERSCPVHTRTVSPEALAAQRPPGPALPPRCSAAGAPRARAGRNRAPTRGGPAEARVGLLRGHARHSQRRPGPRCIHLASAWRRPSRRSAPPSSGIWRRKKGAYS